MKCKKWKMLQQLCRRFIFRHWIHSSIRLEYRLVHFNRNEIHIIYSSFVFWNNDYFSLPQINWNFFKEKTRNEFGFWKGNTKYTFLFVYDEIVTENEKTFGLSIGWVCHCDGLLNSDAKSLSFKTSCWRGHNMLHSLTKVWNGWNIQFLHSCMDRTFHT